MNFSFLLPVALLECSIPQGSMYTSVRLADILKNEGIKYYYRYFDHENKSMVYFINPEKIEILRKRLVDAGLEEVVNVR